MAAMSQHGSARIQDCCSSSAIQGPALPRCIHRVSRRLRNTLVCRAVADLAPQTAHNVVLPPSLANNVVVLDAPNPDVPGGLTRVYLLGMSHVSKVSVDQVKELVRTVRPDVVGVELCRDRVPLLVDDSLETAGTLLWHCRKIEIEGIPDVPEWPKAESLLPLLQCQPGRPVTTQDIEGDVITLLSTGLFRQVRPSCQNAGYKEAPAFLATPGSEGAQEGVKLQTVPPLGCIKFVVQERSLPPITDMSVRVDSSLKAIENPADDLAKICSETMAANSPTREGGQLPAFTCLLRARQSIAALFGAPVVVTYLGVETGKVEALVRLARDTDSDFVSGFEGSAANGEGWGIEMFRPKKNLFKLSEKLYLPMEVVDSIRAQARGLPAGTSGATSTPGADGNGNGAAPLPPPRTEYRIWTKEEVEKCDPPTFTGDFMADTLGAVLTGLYAKYQMQAARKLKLTPGAAWQAAMLAATEVGCQQVVLIDRPTAVTERKLTDTLVANSGLRMGAAAGLVFGTLIAAIASDVLDPATELAGFVGSIAAATGLVWPLVGPIREMAQLADMTPEQIEDTVAIKKPIAGGDLSQPIKVFGEDALLEWPGAMEPVIRDRDAYMAKALAGLATGINFSPLFMRDEQSGQAVWRYMMPDGAPVAAAPAGLGDGAAKPLSGVRTVVGVVGSAHVPGMVKEWKEAVQQPTAVDNLLVP